MRDQWTQRLFSAALVVIGLAAVGAVIYLSIVEREVNDYLAGLAGLAVGALLPSPLSSQIGTVTARIDQPPNDPIPVKEEGVSAVDLLLVALVVAVVVLLVAVF